MKTHTHRHYAPFAKEKHTQHPYLTAPKYTPLKVADLWRGVFWLNGEGQPFNQMLANWVWGYQQPACLENNVGTLPVSLEEWC